MWVTFNRFSTIFEAFVPHFYLCISSFSKTFWIIQIVSVEECSSLTQNLMQIRCSTRSVILNVTASQYTCSLNGITTPTDWGGDFTWPQWSHYCSHVYIPVHSPWTSMPGYIDVTQAVLIMLTMVGHFLDRPRHIECSVPFMISDIHWGLLEKGGLQYPWFFHNPSRNLAGTTFKKYLECSHISPPPLLPFCY